ncbi:MAG TPA: GFA family protein [Acetobacteraceae bacterium]|nr:GFA family protein [Acetobacteraceae bacterium]
MADQEQGLEGGCACGAVRYRLEAAPMFVHCCHCRDCQRQTGSAFVLNALIETDRLSVLAREPQPISVPTDSGRPHRIFRCPTCQTAVWSEYGGRAALRFVRIGTLDDPTALKPDVHIYARSKLPWLALPADAPAFESYYDAKQLWPAASLERRRAVFGG